ncbi:MAG: glycine betaine/L-proline ABC transporter ATP-binding protein [Acidimicrobiia bacterium]|nr:glycine betaine/L-proline ABC transporter ATP-binding protein [Acidimicrobiia bacterium]NNL47174.1 glycine betaine/L-proline ABC transporter ATP-binding protein [Acidimicrobiia bacterium]
MDEANASCLELTGVWKIFGTKSERALDMAEKGASRAEILSATNCTVGVHNVTFDVNWGETFVVMGLSGSGKSTLIRCIAQLTDVTRGSIDLDGSDLTRMSEADLRQVRREKMSMVFQHFGLLPHRRVLDNVAYGLEIQGVKKQQRAERALEVLEIVGLEGWGNHYPQQLSGGMQQRVGLARALAVDPQLLFFDEPFSALDPLIRRDMQDELIRLQEQMHRTIVFITHDFAEAIKLGDRIAIMKDGALDQIGTAAELITNPATDYVAEFTKDVPKAKVLTAADVMEPLNGANIESDRVLANASIESILPSLLTRSEPMEVIDTDGVSVGMIDRQAVARVLEI